MKIFKKVQNFLTEKVEPMSYKLTQNKTLSTIMESMMATLPIMIGGAVFSLLANFPLPAVTTFLTNIGIKEFLDSFVTTQNNLTPVFISFLIGYTYAKKEGINPIPSGIFSLLTYFMLIPENIPMGEGNLVAYSAQYLGGNGIFVSIIFGILVAKIYVFITKKKIILKLPDSVPPMVAQSFEPLFSGFIIIGLVIILKAVVSISPFENVFNVITVLIQGPIMKLGANVPALIILQTAASVLWYFGIHPLAITSLYIPVFTTILTDNITAYMSGQPLPYLEEGVVYLFTNLGGAGSLMGLAICMVVFGKSQRYKVMGKISIVPSIFNIQEPIMFGFPIILNPMFFLHLVLTPSISMGIGYLAIKLGLFNLNPVVAVMTPWTMPFPITGFLVGGLPLMLIFLAIILLNVLLYLPLFMVLDKKELQEEQKLEAALEAEKMLQTDI
ncbi:PTS sugar transporter subunit IIC [Trichococcus alkaliphilus]|uniref:PTS sugar transporter subunit IIC n=1 Tax=Trichococcus alkaliphilus TaxID=2052943 RepID=UPI001374AA8F|nr:PTS transporter subunit EIIC [Trichococcus alkaliphilus]